MSVPEPLISDYEGKVRSMSLEQLSSLCGIASATLVLMITLVRQRRFGLDDIGLVLAAFMAAAVLPGAVALCWYGLFANFPSVPNTFDGQHRYLMAGGLVVVLIGATGLWKLISHALTLESQAAQNERKPKLSLPSVPTVSTEAHHLNTEPEAKKTQ